MNDTGRGEVLLQSLRANFYALNPSDTYIRDLKDVPNIVATALPVMMLMTVTEALILRLSGRSDKWRLYNVIINYSCGGLAEAATNFMFRGAELAAYVWIFNNWKFMLLPWNSLYTYMFALIGIDFCYYWWHRAAHEMAFMWTAHYIHHSSEDFNMSLGTRVSFTMRPFKWLYFVPLAFFGLPPSIFLIHNQLGYVWGAWTHNETVPKFSKIIPGLGHLVEFLMITPSHHRVHHGANRYCIDKNYGQYLVIWDRIFGTFAEEREDEVIVYGTLGQKDTNNIMELQLHPWLDLLEKVKSMKTFGDKFRAVVYGPGWTPGQPRLGNPDDIPDVRGRKKNNLTLPAWFSVYMTVHCCLVFFSYMEMMGRIQNVGKLLPLINLTYMVVAYTALGGLYNGDRYSVVLEPIRLLGFLALSQVYPMFGSPAFLSWVCRVNALSLLLCPAVGAYTFSRSKTSQTIREKAE